MIGQLTGVLATKKAPQILVNCQGVGYEVEVSMTTYYRLPEVGEPVSVWTHLQIKDDAHALIGFETEQERELFRRLIKVNGVGSKMALTILSGINIQAFSDCIHQNDITALTRLPGVGKKTAERLIVEMRDKIDGLTDSSNLNRAVHTAKAGSSASLEQEATAALQTLGYKSQDAENMVKHAQSRHADIDNVSTLIRKALQASVHQK